MERFLLIALGAAAGANCRYLVGVWAGGRLGAAFPFGTLIVNTTGSFMLGLLLESAGERLALTPQLRLLLGVGFLGSYTTFSSYSVESMRLLESGGVLPALANIVANNVLSLVCALLGIAAARFLAT